MTITYEGKMPEKCEASADFECKNADKSLKELGVFYDSVLPKGEKPLRVCESCHLTHGAGKHLGLRYELQENGEWKQIEVEVDQKKLAKMEQKVEDGFFDKVRKYAKHIPFAETAVACYYCATDPKTPLYAKMALLGALAYFISPIDFVPDVIPVVGFLDDAAVIVGVAKLFDSHLKKRHRKASKHFWEGNQVPGCDCPYCASF